MKVYGVDPGEPRAGIDLCILGCPLCGEEIHRGVAGSVDEYGAAEIDAAWAEHFARRHPVRMWLNRVTRGFLGIQGA